MKPYKNEFVVCGVYVTLKQIIQMWSIYQKVPYHTTLQYFKHGWEKSCISNSTLGTFIKDVRQFWAILDMPTYPCPMFSILKGDAITA